MSTLDRSIATLEHLQTHIAVETAKATAAAAAAAPTHNFAGAIRILDDELNYAAEQRALATLDRTKSKKNNWRLIARDRRFDTLDDLERVIGVACDTMSGLKGQYTAAERARQAAATEIPPAAAQPTAHATADPAPVPPPPAVRAETRTQGGIAAVPVLRGTPNHSSEENDYSTALAKLELLQNQTKTPDIDELLRDLINQVKHLKRTDMANIIDLTVVLNSTYQRLTIGNRSTNYRSIYEETAQTMQGHPSPVLRALGYTMLALSIALAIAAVVFIPHIVGTAAIVAYSAGLGGSSILAAVSSFSFFANNRATGLCKTMTDLNKKMLRETEYSIPQEPATAAVAAA